jgi:hypothetical protein
MEREPGGRPAHAAARLRQDGEHLVLDDLSGPPFMLHDIASKGAVFAMTRSMSRELGPHGPRPDPGARRSGRDGTLSVSAASDAITGQALNVDNGMVHW